MATDAITDSSTSPEGAKQRAPGAGFDPLALLDQIVLEDCHLELE